MRDDFSPDSDVDVLVRFRHETKLGLFDLMRMEDELSGILGRRADLVQPEGLVNPFRRKSILESREVIYADPPA